MIYYKCTDESTEALLEQSNEIVKMFFFNIARLINSSGGYLVVYDVLPPGIVKAIPKFLPKGKQTHLPFPTSRLKKIIAAVNAVTVVDQNHWPVRFEKDIVEGKFIQLIEIAIGAKANATFLKQHPLLAPSLRNPLRASRIPDKVSDSHTEPSNSDTSDQENLTELGTEPLSLHDDEIDLAEMQAQESRMEPYREALDQT